MPLIGRHNVLNALVAVAVAAEHGVSPSDAVARLASLSAGDKRGEVREVSGAILINDCYNSNPQALDSMVAALAQTPAKRRIVIAGEMLELGPGRAGVASRVRPQDGLEQSGLRGGRARQR